VQNLGVNFEINEKTGIFRVSRYFQEGGDRKAYSLMSGTSLSPVCATPETKPTEYPGTQMLSSYSPVTWRTEGFPKLCIGLFVATAEFASQLFEKEEEKESNSFQIGV
jgi:hypothetical protein